MKLRLSRKLLFASGLLFCFSGLTAGETDIPNSDARVEDYIGQLRNQADINPIDRLARLILDQDRSGTAIDLISCYDGFIELLDDSAEREELSKLRSEDRETCEPFLRARALGERFQGALDGLFFDQNSRLWPLVREFGVF